MIDIISVVFAIIGLYHNSEPYSIMHERFKYDGLYYGEMYSWSLTSLKSSEYVVQRHFQIFVFLIFFVIYTQYVTAFTFALKSFSLQHFALNYEIILINKTSKDMDLYYNNLDCISSLLTKSDSRFFNEGLIVKQSEHLTVLANPLSSR